jgi:hypothetical protein
MTKHTEISRRDFLRWSGVAGLTMSGTLLGCITPRSCPIAWPPSILAPVNWGFSDIPADKNLLTPIRVLYPSTATTPQDAVILSCGQYPLVLFLHGQCDATNEYLEWTAFFQELAKSGFVVVLGGFTLPSSIPDSSLDLNPYLNILSWMRNTWENKQVLGALIEDRLHANVAKYRPSPTALIGHSYGAVATASLARAIKPSVLVAMSGEFGDSDDFPNNFRDVVCPKLFMSGGAQFEEDGAPIDQNSEMFPQVGTPYHTIQFQSGGHWDYVAPASQCLTPGGTGTCTNMAAIASDYVTAFCSKYITPLTNPNLATQIGACLIPPPLNPIIDGQQAFQANFLSGFPLLNLAGGTCPIQHRWVNQDGSMGSIDYPLPPGFPSC